MSFSLSSSHASSFVPFCIISTLVSTLQAHSIPNQFCIEDRLFSVKIGVYLEPTLQYSQDENFLHIKTCSKLGFLCHP